MKKIYLIIPIILLMIFISEFINGESKENVSKNEKKTDYYIKNIEYENLTIKLNKDLKSGEIITQKDNYKLKSSDIKIDGDEIEIFYDLKKKIFYLNKKELISEN